MIELTNIRFSADGKDIIQGVDMALDSNKFIVITGPNGGGKSTLAKLMAGIEQPDSGHIFFDGEDITHLSITERANLGISYAFQQPVRFKGVKVFDLLRIASGKGDLTQSEACDYLSQVGLCAKDYVERGVDNSLSGGELKRIEIATVIARGKKLSIFDEPEAGIDLWSFGHLIDVFETMYKNIDQSTIVIISHQERILDIADEIIVVADGKIVDRGTKDKILPTLLSDADECRFTGRSAK